MRSSVCLLAAFLLISFAPGAKALDCGCLHVTLPPELDPDEEFASAQPVCEEADRARLARRCEKKRGQACYLAGEAYLRPIISSCRPWGPQLAPPQEKLAARYYELSCRDEISRGCTKAAALASADRAPKFEARGCSLGDGEACLLLADREPARREKWLARAAANEEAQCLDGAADACTALITTKKASGRPLTPEAERADALRASCLASGESKLADCLAAAVIWNDGIGVPARPEFSREYLLGRAEEFATVLPEWVGAENMKAGIPWLPIIARRCETSGSFACEGMRLLALAAIPDTAARERELAGGAFLKEACRTGLGRACEALHRTRQPAGN